MENKIKPSIMLLVLIIALLFLIYIYFEHSNDYAFFSIIFLLIISYTKAYIL